MIEFTTRQELKIYQQIEILYVDAGEVKIGDRLIAEEDLGQPTGDVMIRVVDHIDYHDDGTVSVFAMPQPLYPMSSQQHHGACDRLVRLVGVGDQKLRAAKPCE